MQYCFLIIFLIFFSVAKAAENGKKVNLPDLKDAKGPFIYYVITCRGEGGQKMPIFDYFQY